MPTTEELQTQVESLTSQVRALSGEVQGWRRVAKDAGDLIQYDSRGIPVGWNEQALNGEPGGARGAPGAGGAEAGLMDSKQQIEMLQRNGFITQTKAQELWGQALREAAQQIYAASRGDMLLFRNLDRLMGEEKFKDLGKYDSPLSKKTADILQRNGWGKPMDGAKVDSWEKWFYTSPEIMRHAAAIGRAELWDEGQSAAAAGASAQANQNAAALSGTPGAQAQPPGGPLTDDKVKEMVAAGKGKELDAAMREETTRNMEALGV